MKIHTNIPSTRVEVNIIKAYSSKKKYIYSYVIYSRKVIIKKLEIPASLLFQHVSST